MVSRSGKKAVSLTVDIAVVGAGLIGLAAAIALHAEGKRVVIIDSKKRAIERKSNAWDPRVYALTPATQKWLQSIDVWPLVDHARVNDVSAMSLWNTTSDKALNLEAEDANLSKLAYIIENKNLMQALWEKLESSKIPILAASQCQDLTYKDDGITLSLENGEMVSAALLLAADGENSFVRQQLRVATKDKSFNQTALVANYSVEKGHNNIARQWFAPHSTLALLPLPNKHVSMVWSVSTEFAVELLSLSSAKLAEEVQVQSRHTLGQLKPVSDTFSFELKQVTANQLIADRVAFIGDAAHRVHPMAGQGANLGFRDVMALQAIMASSHHLQDIGEVSNLRRYERSRKADIASMNILTSGLNNLFASENRAIKNLTTLGMSQLNKYPSIKDILIKQAVM